MIQWGLRLCAPFLIFSLVAHAGRPFVTDDAALTVAHSCQVESWVHRHGVQTEIWMIPACNPGGNFEISAAVGRIDPDSDETAHDLVLQGKTLFRPVSAGDFGWGLAFGGVVAVGQGSVDDRLSELYAYVPLTVASEDERTLLHVNLGVLRDREVDQSRTTWGLGVGHAVTARWSIFAETYGNDVDAPSVQAGLTRSFAAGRYHFDLTAGRQLDGVPDGTFVSIGLNAYFDPFLAPAPTAAP